MIDGVMFTNSLGTVVGQIVEVTVRIHCLMSTIIGMYGPPQNCKRKIKMTVWSAPMYSAFGGVQDSWP